MTATSEIQRRGRAPISWGAMAGFATLIFMILSSMLAGVHFIDLVGSKLDHVSSQIAELKDIRSDVAKLQAHVEDLDKSVNRIIDQASANERLRVQDSAAEKQRK